MDSRTAVYTTEGPKHRAVSGLRDWNLRDPNPNKALIQKIKRRCRPSDQCERPMNTGDGRRFRRQHRDSSATAGVPPPGTGPATDGGLGPVAERQPIAGVTGTGGGGGEGERQARGHLIVVLHGHEDNVQKDQARDEHFEVEVVDKVVQFAPEALRLPRRGRQLDLQQDVHRPDEVLLVVGQDRQLVMAADEGIDEGPCGRRGRGGAIGRRGALGGWGGKGPTAEGPRAAAGGAGGSRFGGGGTNRRSRCRAPVGDQKGSAFPRPPPHGPLPFSHGDVLDQRFALVPLSHGGVPGPAFMAQPQGCIGRGGAAPPPPPLRGAQPMPSHCPPQCQVPGSMVFVTDSNRPQPLWQPPPTACPTAAGATSEVPSLLMHPWPAPTPSPCLSASLLSLAFPQAQHVPRGVHR